MNTDVSAFDHAHHFGDPATHPITGLPSRLAALLLLAGNDHARRRALPVGSAGPYSGAFNRGIKVKVHRRCAVIAPCHELEDMPTRQVNQQTVLQRIQTEMERHLLEHDAPDEICGFLSQHWARLLTGIFMAKGNQHADWLAGWDTVNALLWSLAPKNSRGETEKMLHMLPTLLGRMREGCVALEISAPECDAMFERLAMMHAAVARAGLRCRSAPEFQLTHLADVVEHEVPVDLALLNPPKADVFEFDPPPVSGQPLPMPDLKIGDQVHFRMQGHARNLYLNWISPAGGMYLFGNNQGLDAMTFTRARLAERFAQGQAALVCD